MHLSFLISNYPLALAGLGIWSNIYVKKPQLSERSEFCGFSTYCFSLPSAAAVPSLVDYRRHSSRLFSHVRTRSSLDLCFFPAMGKKAAGRQYN